MIVFASTVAVVVIVVVVLSVILSIKDHNLSEGFSYLTASMDVEPTPRPKMSVVDTSLIHDQWITDKFQIHRTPTPLKDSYVYADTATAALNPKFDGMYLTSILPRHRVTVLFTNEVSEMTIPLTRYLSDRSIASQGVDVWVRTDVEKSIARSIFASTSPGTQMVIKYTSSPLSQPGVYCMLIDTADSVLSYARRSPCALLTYDDMNLDHSRYFLPFHDIKTLDVASVLDRPSRDGARTQVLSFPYCVWSPNDHVSQHVQDTEETLRMAGFYASFFKVCRHVLKSAESAHVADDDGGRPTFIRHSMVEEQLGIRRVIAGPKPLPKGDTWVSVANMTNVYENSHKARYTDVVETLDIKADSVIVKIPRVPATYTKVYLEDLGKVADVVRNEGGLATVVVWLSDAETRDRVLNAAKYSCVSNAKLEFDFQCEVEPGGVWDRPCQSDFDCPFHNLDAGRGGCDSLGYCEMPLGVDRKGFRKYDSNARPFCVGCKDPFTDPHCCGEDASKFAFAMGDLGENLMSRQEAQ